MLQGEEDNRLDYTGFVCASGHPTRSVPSSTENIKIALSIQLHTGVCPDLLG